MEPLRDIFATLFFASIGMLIDPVFLWNNLELILGLVALVFVGKFLIITPLVKVFRYPLKTALLAGLGLAQIGEFSFVLASEGRTLGLVSRRVYLLILGTTAVTLVLTPFVLRLVPHLFNWAETLSWLKPYLDSSSAPLEVATDFSMQDHVVVCGYGRMGRNLVRLVQEHGLSVVVIEQSESKIQQLREVGVPYVYGNAGSLRVLETAGVDKARSLAIALRDPMSTRLCLKRALELAPDLDSVVCANHDKDMELLYQLGAREVVQPEFEASLELATHLLTGMGLALPVIQQEMQQIRGHHYLELRPEQPASRWRDLQMATKDMNSRWYRLPAGSPLTGMTLEELDLRYLTGVSLMAIRRARGQEVDYPNAQTILEEGDRLLVVGESEELVAFDELAKGKAAVPEENMPCHWVMVPADSPVVGQTLSKLYIQRRCGVQVQAIRRDGRFIRFPDSGIELQARDQLLLCGGYSAMEQLQQWLAPTLQLPLPIPIVTATEQDAYG